MSLIDLDIALQYFSRYFTDYYKKFGQGEDDRKNKNVAVYIMN